MVVHFTWREDHERAPATEPASFPFTAQDHHLHFYPGGVERLAALLSLIDQAKVRLVAVFYIFGTDKTAVTVRDALVRAALRGVDVRLIIDSFGSSAHDGFFAPLKDAGGAYYRFQPRFNVRYFIRNHQKFIIADDRVAMLGGFNIADSYFAAPADGGWTDLGFTLEGPVVAQLVGWWARLESWCTKRKRQFREIRKLVRRWQVTSGPVQLLIGGPTRGLSSWARRISGDLVHAQRLDMMMAYFAPSHKLLRRIKRIALYGEARLIFAGKSDNTATVGATRLLMGGLLRKGAEVREYDARMLHTKLIVVDDTVYFGSANLDIRSLYLNLELVLQIEDAALAGRMRQLITAYEPDTTVITPQVQKARAGLLTLIRWSLSWFLITVVDYTINRKLNLGQ